MKHVLHPAVLLAWAMVLVCGAVGAEQVIWKAPAMTGWRDADNVEVHGTLENGMFRPDAIAIAQPAGPPAPALIPLGENILPLAQARAFGVEERVGRHLSTDALRIECRAGTAPAGIVLHWPQFRLPALFRGTWTLKGKSEGAIGVAAVGGNDDAPADPPLRWTEQALSIPLHEQKDQALVLTCPEGAASVLLEAITLFPETGVTAAHSRGSWIWREQDWRADPVAFVRAASIAGFTELAVQVPAKPDLALARLRGALEEKGILLRLLDGDPSMATPEGLERALIRMTRLGDWCERHWPAKARPMLELDIEPYGEAGFAADPASGWRGWSRAITALAAVWGSPVAVDVPWWMQRSAGGAAALQNLRGAVGEIVVMAYRTDPQLILDAVEPWLAREEMRVQVAIETGPVAAEVTRMYRRAARGTLQIGDAGVSLLSSPQAAGPGEAVFEMTAQSVTDPARVSFHGSATRASETERRLVPILKGWHSFSGFRIHGWIPPPPTLPRRRIKFHKSG